MSAPKVVALDPKPIGLSNEDFLRNVFGADWTRAHVCGFRQDPGTLDAEGLRHLWAGGPAKPGLEHFTDDVNAFFVISVFHPDPSDGKQRRRKANFDAAHCIVIDDVDLRGMGAKTSAKVPAEKVKLDPSWALETSPGNFQLGYILKNGDPRGGKVSALLDALVASGLCPDGSDPGMKGVTRYVRLPVGKNTKAKYGKPGWDHVLGSWHPKRTYTLEAIADAYGVRAEVDAAEDDLLGGTRGSFTPQDDVIWNAILNSGTAQSEDLAAGKLHVTCPFVEDHTGRADSGCTYLGDGRWSCFHGHCDERPFEEFTAKFRENFPEAWREAVGESFGGLGGSDFGDAGIAPSVGQKLKEEEIRDLFGEAAAEDFKEQEAVRAVAQKTGRPFWFSDAAAGGAVLNMPWLVKGLIPPEGLGVMYGPPGTGKSFVALDLAARVAGGLVWQGLSVKKPGMVLYVASEGGTQSLRNRVLAWMQGNGNGAVPVLVYPGALRLGREDKGGTPEKVAGWVKRQAKSAGLEVSLVVVDTLARNMTGDENATADMNAFVGACDELQRRTGAFVLLVHHTGKDASKGSRGSSALLGAIDLELELAREPGKGNPGSIYVSKAREGDMVGKTFGYLLQTVDFGKDADGDPVTSLYVEETVPPARGSSRKPGVWESAILEVYEDMVGDGNYVSKKALSERIAEWSRDGALPNVNNGNKVAPTKVREEIGKLVDKGGWKVAPDGDGIAREVQNM